MDTLKGDKELKKMALDYVENYNSDEDDNDVEIVEVKEKPKWDCETIISTYSNLYNRPKVLDDGFRLVSLDPTIKNRSFSPKCSRDDRFR